MAAAAALLAAAAPARGDQTVVTATVYPGQGSARAMSAGLSTLSNCPPPPGVSNPMYLYPGGQPFGWPSGSTWTVSTVLTCGLGLAAGSVTDVQVQSPTQGIEAPLSAADLSDPGQWHDPQAPDALPLVTVDGDQVTYFRPFRGGSDANARDEVLASGAPVGLLVYENGSMLTVNASQRRRQHTSKTITVSFAAGAHDASGAAIAASRLHMSWSFGDGATSTAATPSHSFATGVDYYVTVQVTDPATGAAGAATVVVDAATPGSGSGNRTGGSTPTRSTSPAGPGKPRPQHHSTAPQTTTSTTTPATTGTATTPTTSPATTTAPTPTPTPQTTVPPTTPAPPPVTPAPTPTHRRARRPASHHRQTPPAPVGHGAVVAGRLISDVTPLAPQSSPLVSAAAAPPASSVRQATTGSSTPAIAAPLAVVMLLGLGVGRELRGRR